MSRWQNFSIWRGRLPHWRADDVTYYVTFRHRRALTDHERAILVSALVKPDGRKWDLLILCVLPEETELVFRVREALDGRPYELTDVVEKAKTKAGRLIIKKSGERWPPFYTESYDRIIRDEAELEERLETIYQAPVQSELVEEPEGWPGLWLSEDRSSSQAP